MTRPQHFHAGRRARWLAELEQALEQAQRIIDKLDPEASKSDEVLHLRSRIAAIASEVDRLRRGALHPTKPACGRSPLLPWKGFCS